MTFTLRTLAFSLAITPVLFSSCGNDDNGSPSPNNPNNPNNPNQPATDYYFKVTIDGQQVELLHNVNTYVVNPYLSIRSEDNVIKAAELGVVAINPFIDKNSGSVGLGRTFSQAPTEQQMLDIWATGPKGYTTDSLSPYGAVVYYVDNNGKSWTTTLGSGNQTGSTFTVTEITPFNNTLTGKLSRTVKGTFSCKLYSEQGEVKNATNGSFRGVVQFEE